MGLKTWEQIATRLSALDNALRERANAVACAAGVGIGRNVWTNALIARESGRPWVGVDYSKIREAMRIDARRSELYVLRARLWDAYERAHYPERYALRSEACHG